MLSYQDLKRVVDDGLLFPHGIREEMFQPASIDLTLSDSFYDPHSGQSYRDVALTLEPDDFTLGCTVERIHVPRSYAVQVNGKSSLARQGLLVHATAGFVDPGFEGQITLELKNLSKDPIVLLTGMRIAQVHVFALSSATLVAYGNPKLGSHYQGQSGAQPAADLW